MGVGGSGVGVAFEAGPGTALGVPEVALEAVDLVGVGGEDPAEEDVQVSFAGVLQEALAQVHVVSSHPLGDGALRADDLQKIDAGAARRDRVGDVRLGQTDRGLDAGRGRQAGEERRLRRIGFARFKPRPSRCNAGRKLFRQTVERSSDGPSLRPVCPWSCRRAISVLSLRSRCWRRRNPRSH
jgi:hypothetical protein